MLFERASEKVESKPYAVKWRSDHCQSPPPQSTGTGNWNASNAMQIMSFRFSIKMLNYYFALRYKSQRWWTAVRQTNSQSDRRWSTQPDQHTYAPVITALIYCLWFCDINLFIIFTGQRRRCPAVASDQWKK